MKDTGPTQKKSSPVFVLAAFLGILSFSPLLSVSDNPQLLSDEIIGILQEELSGEIAKDHVIEITRHHRIQGSSGYADAALYVLSQLRRYGFSRDEAWIESFRSDGKVNYQGWQSPSGWSIREAELRMVEPSEERIVGYPEIAMSVITYSNPGQVRAELVDVGQGTSEADYEGRDVQGKLVLATGYGGSVHRLAVLKYGAAAVICYLDDDRAREHPDMLQYTGMWPRTDELANVTFGFNLTNRQGRKLKDLLSNGSKVVLDARVDGVGLEPGTLDVVVAVIRGNTRADQELLFTAHLDHPKESANDNASGSAAILDIARSLKKLVRSGRLDRPETTLRFLWVPEFYGTMAYVDNYPNMKGPELGGNVLGSLNLDMVGEDLELLHSQLNITWTPATISSALTDVTQAMAAVVDDLSVTTPRGSRSRFNYRMSPFSGGSDHVVFNDGTIRIPSMMFTHSPDYTHHTSEDTPDKVDPVELERCEIIAASSLYYLSALSESQSLDLVGLVTANAQGRLGQDGRRAMDWLLKSSRRRLSRVYEDSLRAIDFALARERRSLKSILEFASHPSTQRLAQVGQNILGEQARVIRLGLRSILQQKGVRPRRNGQLSGMEARAARTIPSRLTRGPLPPDQPSLLLPEARRAWYEGPDFRSLDAYLLVNLIDGHRSILDIRNLLSAATRPVQLQDVDRYIRDLRTTGFISLEDR